MIWLIWPMNSWPLSSTMPNKCSIWETRFLIWHLHTDIESGDYFSAYLVLAAYVDAAEQLVMIDCETWNLIHITLNFEY